MLNIGRGVLLPSFSFFSLELGLLNDLNPATQVSSRRVINIFQMIINIHTLSFLFFKFFGEKFHAENFLRGQHCWGSWTGKPLGRVLTCSLELRQHVLLHCLGSLVSLTDKKETKSCLLTFASQCSWQGCSKGRGMFRVTACPSCLQSVNKYFCGCTWGFLCASYYGYHITRSLLGSCLHRAAALFM